MAPVIYISNCRFTKNMDIVTNNGCYVHVVFTSNTIEEGAQCRL
jgi:hypothetical protein